MMKRDMAAIRCIVSVFVVLLSLTSFGSSQTFDNNSNRFPKPQNRQSITFNRQNLGMSHSANNFNPHSSFLVASRPIFRPRFPNDHFFSSQSFNRRPFRTTNLNTPRIPVPANGITFGVTQNTHTNNDRESFTNSNDNKNSNIPPVKSSPTINPTPSAPVITFDDRSAPINFGISQQGPVNFPGPISNKPTNFGAIFPTESVSTTVSPAINSGRIPFTGFGHTTIPTDINLANSGEVTTPVVFFPGRSDKPTPSPIEEINLNSTGNSIEYNNDCLLNTRAIIFEGNCSVILHQGPCQDGHWLVLSEETGTAYCAERKCPWSKVYYEGECVNAGDFDICRRGQILYVDITGKAECDCEPGYIYDPRSQNCYAEHEQGFCPTSFYIERNDDGKRFGCVSNPCGRDDYVQASDGNCYIKNYIGRCKSVVQVAEDYESADCDFIVPHSIFQVPTLRTCPEGSRRDFFHKCRTVFRIPTQVSVHPTKGKCKKGYIRGPRGGCRKVIDLFG